MRLVPILAILLSALSLSYTVTVSEANGTYVFNVEDGGTIVVKLSLPSQDASPYGRFLVVQDGIDCNTVVPLQDTLKLRDCVSEPGVAGGVEVYTVVGADEELVCTDAAGRSYDFEVLREFEPYRLVKSQTIRSTSLTCGVERPDAFVAPDITGIAVFVNVAISAALLGLGALLLLAKKHQ